MESLGLDLKIFLAQIVNFSVLLFFLNKILYKPLLKLIDERNNKIAKAIKHSEDVEKKLEGLQLKEDAILLKIRKKAEKERQEIIDVAQKEKGEIIEQAKLSAKKELDKGFMQLERAKEEVVEDISKKYLDSIVAELMRKVDKSTKKDDFPLLNRILKS